MPPPRHASEQRQFSWSACRAPHQPGQLPMCTCVLLAGKCAELAKLGKYDWQQCHLLLREGSCNVLPMFRSTARFLIPAFGAFTSRAQIGGNRPRGQAGSLGPNDSGLLSSSPGDASQYDTLPGRLLCAAGTRRPGEELRAHMDMPRPRCSSHSSDFGSTHRALARNHPRERPMGMPPPAC